MGRKKGHGHTHHEEEEDDDVDEDIQTKLANDPRLLAALQAKLGQLEGASSGYLETLPAEVIRRVHALKKLQVEQVKISAEFEKELAALEQRYASRYAPLFDKRSQIISGDYEPTEEESHWSEDDEEDEDGQKVEKKQPTPSAEPVKGIPHFWLTALQHCDQIAMTIQEHDVPVLQHLTDIKVTLHDPPGTGFSLHFHFSPNEFFTDSVLVKKYTIDIGVEDKALVYEGPVFSKSEGCEIHWNAGKNVTVKLVKKKQRKKGGSGAGQTRTVTKAVPQESFFSFFSPPKAPQADDDDDEENEDLGALAGQVEADFELGEIIRERIVPSAVIWFTGEAQNYDDDDFYGEEGEEGEEGEGDDDDEDADPNYKPPAIAPGAQGERPECKQS